MYVKNHMVVERVTVLYEDLEILADVFHTTTCDGKNDLVLYIPSNGIVINSTVGGNDAQYVNHHSIPNAELVELKFGLRKLVCIVSKENN